MFCKLLKNDLKKNMRWMWILFVSTILVAGIARGFKELGENIVFFKILGIFFDSVFYSLAVNVILQPFLRNFFNFTKSFYGDESYLTHTLPVTKKQLFNSKFLTAFIEICLGFICLVVSLLIMFVSPTFFETLKFLISTIILGNFSLSLVLTLFVVLVFVEFLMFITIIFYSIILAYKSKEKRVLKTFMLTAVFSFIALTVLAVVMLSILLINGVDFKSSMLMLSNNTFMSIIITGIIVYSVVIVIFYLLAKKEFSKGVNVD